MYKYTLSALKQGIIIAQENNNLKKKKHPHHSPHMELERLSNAMMQHPDLPWPPVAVAEVGSSLSLVPSLLNCRTPSAGEKL